MADQKRFKLGMGYAYVDQIKDGQCKGKYGVFHTSCPWKGHSTRDDLSPTDTPEEIHIKLDDYVKVKGIRQ